ncbi:MAG: tetratricopeptide repeat protein [Deltaproteobacteria bacterium]|nr:tetratricopeptide repeat protein [Candidatus Zymogenaceae bacterium]
MFCNLCGANVPDGSPRCSKCKNFFPKNLGAYTYKVVLDSFSDYTAKKETAKFLAARTPDATLAEVVKRLDSLPLVIAKRVDEIKARELEEALTRLGARTRFVPLLENERQKAELIAELKRPLRRSYTEGKPLAIPKSVQRLKTEAKKRNISLKFIFGAVTVLIFIALFIILPRYYSKFYEEQKNNPGPVMDSPTPESPSRAPGDTGEETDSPPADITPAEVPAIVIPEIVSSPRDPAASEGLSFFQRGLYEEAMGKFLEARKKDPADRYLNRNVALCYLALGWQALNENDLDGAEKNLNDCLAYSEEYQAYEGLAYIAGKKNDLALAEDYYLKALEINPKADKIMLNLGIIYYYQEKLDLALSSLTEYAQANPTDKTAQYYIEKINRENPVESALDTRETGHFIVKYSGSNKNLVADFLLAVLEDAHAIVGEKLGYYPDRKITVILYTDQEFKTATNSPGWAGAIFDGKIRIPVKGASDSTDLLRKMIIHEYTHAVVFDLAGNECPTWLNEGLAQGMEGSPVENADALAMDYVKLKGPNVPLGSLTESFTNMSPENAYSAYMLSLSAVDFLVKKYGMSSVRTILAGIKGGKTVDQAIRAALLISLDDFVDRWVVYLRNKYR